MSNVLTPALYYRVSRWLYLRRVPLLPSIVKVSSSGRLKERPRLLFFVESLALGGSQKQSIEVARLLTMNGWAVTVGCLRAEGLLKERVLEAGLPLVEFPIRSLLTPRAIGQLFRAALFIRRQHFQVVQANDLYSNLFAVPAAWLAKTPVIVSSQRDLSHWWWYTPLKRRILRRIQKLSTWTLVNSHAARHDLIAKDKFNTNRLRVVHNGIDINRYTQRRYTNRGRCLPGVPLTHKIVITVANMHFLAKGHCTLISAAQTICREFPGVKFVMVGDGQHRAFLENEVIAAGLDGKFIFLGYRTDIPDLLSCCDVGVLASKAEGLPNAILEYMAAGLPVVATSVGGVPEIIQHEITGLLVPPEDPVALVAAILRLLREEHFAEQLAKAGREHVAARFNFDLLVRSLNEMYTEHPHRKRLANPGLQGISDAH